MPPSTSSLATASDRVADSLVEVTVSRAGHPERRFSLSVGSAHVGRAEDCEVVLSDMGVSRRHARLQVEAGRVVVEDLGSGNGTYHRGARVRRIELADSEQLYIDPFTLTFRFTGGGAASAGRGAKEAPPRPARLVTLSGARLEPVYPIGDQGVSLGRSNQREIVLYDPAASRLQAEIRWQGDGWVLKDDSSANGTFVNGSRTTSRRLRAGDLIRVGDTELRFEEEAAAPTSSPAPVAAADVRGDEPTAAMPVGPQPQPPVNLQSLHAAMSGPTVLLSLPTGLQSAVPTEAAPQATPAPTVPPPSPPPPSPPPPSTSYSSSPYISPTRRPARPERRSGVRGLVIGAVVAFSLLCVTASVAFVGLALRPELLAELGLAREEPPVVPPPPLPPEVQEGLAEGRALFDQGRYFEAMARFYEVRKRDPENAEAERMVYLSSESLLLQAMREAIVSRAAARPATTQR